MSICFTCANFKRPDSDSTSGNRSLCTLLTTRGFEINPHPVGRCAGWERKVSDPGSSCEDCADVAICDATRMAGCADFERKVDEVEPVDDDAEHSCSECAKKDWDLCGGIRLDEGKHKCGVFEPKGECKDCADKVLCGKPSILLARTGCSSFRPHECADFEPKKGHEPLVASTDTNGESEATRYFHSWDKKTGEYTGTVETDGAGDVGLSKYYDYEEYEPPKRPDPDGWHVVKHEEMSQIFLGRKSGDSLIYLDGHVSDCKWSEYKVLARVPEVDWMDGREEK